MEEKYYAIEMYKKQYDDVYMFIPIRLIEGYISENETIFMSDDGIDYIEFEDNEELINDNNKYFGFAISEEFLMKAYSDSSLEVAKMDYYQEIEEKMYLKIFNSKEETEEIEIKSIIENEVFKEKIVYEDIEIQNENFEDKDNETMKLINDFFVKINKQKTQVELNRLLVKLLHFIKRLWAESEIDEINKVEIKEFISFIDTEIRKIINIDDVNIMKKECQILFGVNYDRFEFFADSITDYNDKKFESKKENENKVEEIIQEEKQRINVRELKAIFDDKIIGQEEAKIDVLQAIFMNSLSDDTDDKNSCLLVGPTGSGKTLIAKTLSKALDVPIEIIDSTQITTAGYVGASLDEYLENLLDNANGNLAKAQKGIVVFDEIDKKGSEKNSDVNGKGVLNSLLPFIQGTTYNLKYKGSNVKFDTAKLTVFATGAFSNIAKNKKQISGYSDTKAGFINKDILLKEDVEYEKFEPEDFEKYGNIPGELIGRFTTICQLDGQTVESLKLILTNSSLSPLKVQKTKLNKINIELSWDEEYLDAVAKEAMKLKAGARSLKKMIEKTIKFARWQAIVDYGKYKEIILTKDCVFDNTSCVLIGIDDQKYTVKEIIEKEEILKRSLKRQ